MNRKEFIFKTSAAALGATLVPSLIGCSAQRAVFDPVVLSEGNLARVRGNIFRFTNRGGTVGLLETKNGFVVVDSQFPDAIKPVVDAIAAKQKPVLYLANTHHHADHTSGNIAFKNLTDKIVAHRRVPELQRKAAEAQKNLDQQLYPNILFDDVYKFDLGKEKLTGYHLGAGHTFGDVVYHFENDNVVHMGDLMFINMIPVYRVADGSNSLGWIKVLERALEKFDENTLFIFGHSDKPETSTGTKENLREMKNFLEASNEFVQKAIREGKTSEQILKENTFVPGFANRATATRFPDFIKGIWSIYTN
jgi:glyoxylase-like metal-dependent hydrolase (beta-lactamase superfamily II)